jgi:hypothetical protein
MGLGINAEVRSQNAEFWGASDRALFLRKFASYQDGELSVWKL